MEIAALNNGFAMQAGVLQNKAKNNEAAMQTPLDSSKRMTVLQNQLAEKPQKVQQSTKTDEQTTSLKAEQDSMAELAQKVQQKLKNSGMKIQLEVDKETEKVVVLVKDPVTDEVVRKIPPEELLTPLQAAREMKLAEQDEKNIDARY